jgi:hypothetical protein
MSDLRTALEELVAADDAQDLERLIEAWVSARAALAQSDDPADDWDDILVSEAFPQDDTPAPTKPCTFCLGTGIRSLNDRRNPNSIDCPDCNGTGEAPEVKP